MTHRTRFELSENLQIQLTTEWIPTHKLCLLCLQMTLDYMENIKEPLKKKKKLRSSLTCMYVMHLLLDNANLDHPIMTQMVVSDGEYAVLTSLLIQALLQDNTYSELATMKAGAL